MDHFNALQVLCRYVELSSKESFVIERISLYLHLCKYDFFLHKQIFSSDVTENDKWYSFTVPGQWRKSILTLKAPITTIVVCFVFCRLL